MEYDELASMLSEYEFVVENTGEGFKVVKVVSNGDKIRVVLASED